MLKIVTVLNHTHFLHFYFVSFIFISLAFYTIFILIIFICWYRVRVVVTRLKGRWMPDCRSYKRILIWAWLEFKEWHGGKKESSKVRDAETKWSRSTETFIWITVSNTLDGDVQEMAGHTEKDCAMHGVKSALPTTSSLVHFYMFHCPHVPKRAFLFQRFF